MTDTEEDVVNHPNHYTWRVHECLRITQWMDFNLGNAYKYVYRAGHKDATSQDIKKAIFYLANLAEFVGSKTDFVHNDINVDLLLDGLDIVKEETNQHLSGFFASAITAHFSMWPETLIHSVNNAKEHLENYLETL